MKPITNNTLFYGDNLPILREYVPDESIDLIYLDPPFNSNRSYNVLFKDESGQQSEAQMTAFDDTWHWGKSTEHTYHAIIQDAPERVAVMLGAMREFIGENQMMAYLVMMTARLVELHRVLKPTGSLYLHCDPTASHYLKIILDTIFGVDNFRNEISWKRSNPKSHISINFPNCRDIILRYSKTNNAVFYPVYTEHDKEYVDKAYHYSSNNPINYNDPDGHCPLLVTAAVGAVVGFAIDAGFQIVPQLWNGTSITEVDYHWQQGLGAAVAGQSLEVY